MKELKQFEYEPETLDEFFEMVVDDMVELVDKIRNEFPIDIVGCEEFQSYIYNCSEYTASISAFFEKSFWYELIIKDYNDVVVFECNKY